MSRTRQPHTPEFKFQVVLEVLREERTVSGWVYLAAIIDVHSRFIVDWELSTTIDSTFILTMFKRAFPRNRPGILNSDQGYQVHR